MSSENSLTLRNWVKKVPSLITGFDTVPIPTTVPSFPTGDFAQALSKTLELEKFDLRPSEFKWRSEEELFTNLGEGPLSLDFCLTGFEGSFFWVMPQQDLASLMADLLLKNEEDLQNIQEDYLPAFYEFLAAEAIYALQSLKTTSPFIPKLINSGVSPTGVMLGADVLIYLKGGVKIGRLLISPELQKSIASKMTAESERSFFQSLLSSKIEAVLQLEIGSINLSQEEWSNVKVGDFLLLDRSFIKSAAEKNQVVATLKGYPCFKGEIQGEKVKILEQLML